MSSKSTFSNATSKSYALALYELSKENTELDKVENEIKSLFIQKYLSASLNQIKIAQGIKLEVDVDPINFS